MRDEVDSAEQADVLGEVVHHRSGSPRPVVGEDLLHLPLQLGVVEKGVVVDGARRAGVRDEQVGRKRFVGRRAPELLERLELAANLPDRFDVRLHPGDEALGHLRHRVAAGEPIDDRARLVFEVPVGARFVEGLRFSACHSRPHFEFPAGRRGVARDAAGLGVGKLRVHVRREVQLDLLEGDPGVIGDVAGLIDHHSGAAAGAAVAARSTVASSARVAAAARHEPAGVDSTVTADQGSEQCETGRAKTHGEELPFRTEWQARDCLRRSVTRQCVYLRSYFRLLTGVGTVKRTLTKWGQEATCGLWTGVGSGHPCP